jgi:hypothetical protein
MPPPSLSAAAAVSVPPRPSSSASGLPRVASCACSWLTPPVEYVTPAQWSELPLGPSPVDFAGAGREPLLGARASSFPLEHAARGRALTKPC